MDKEFTEVFGNAYVIGGGLSDENLPNDTCFETPKQRCDRDFTIEEKMMCEPILLAESGEGAFKECEPLGYDVIYSIYLGCLYDVCADHGLRCDALKIFVTECQRKLINVSLDWRPALRCNGTGCLMQHAHYSPCASGCPKTCYNLHKEEPCDKHCEEGCECDTGYLKEFTKSNSFQCVTPEQCGCFDSDGDYHNATEKWISDDCTKRYSCVNQTIHEDPYHCEKHEQCSVADGERKCDCEKDYVRIDGKCTSRCIADPTLCGQDKGYGKCIHDGEVHCNCTKFRFGPKCENYLPRRHCADLYVYHHIHKSGTYYIEPPYPYAGHKAFEKLNVYCDMDSVYKNEIGGWTLISSEMHTKDLMANKTRKQYEGNFGNPEVEDVWIGLDVLHGMTTETITSLRLDATHCMKDKPWIQDKPIYCVYPQFEVLNKTMDYRVLVPYYCHGNDSSSYIDGWVRWDLHNPGPPFQAFDSENNNCSMHYLNVGWWYDEKQMCGEANLNGIQFMCGNDTTPRVDQQYQYAQWNNNPINWAQMWLRPEQYPNYDSTPPDTVETTTPNTPKPPVKTTHQTDTVKVPETTANTPKLPVKTTHETDTVEVPIVDATAKNEDPFDVWDPW